MTWRGLLIIALLASGLGGLWVYKELDPKPVRPAAGHGHGDDHGGAGHSDGEAHAEPAKKAGEHEGHDHPAKPANVDAVSKPADAAMAKPDEHAGHAHDEKKAGGHGEEKNDDHGHGSGEKTPEGVVRMSAEQIEKAKIDTAPAASGTLAKEIVVPGRVTLNLDRKAEIVPKISGTVFSVLKNLGQDVAKGEIVASLESREMAEAKGEYLSAWRAEQLAQSLYEREERLWKQKVTAEQDYLNAKGAHQAAKIKLDQAHQRLHTAGMEDDEIDVLHKSKDESKLRLYEVRSPIAGKVIGRELTVGQIVSTDKPIYTIADLSTVWVETAIAPGDLPFAKVGQSVNITGGARKATGKVVVISPVVDPDTRAAKAVVEIANPDGTWQPGDFVSAQLVSGKQEVGLMVPKDAIQTIKGSKAVFVSHDKGFEMRPVTTGREDSNHVEILSGLEFGESIAVTNTFTLKAELGKAEAEHEH